MQTQFTDFIPTVLLTEQSLVGIGLVLGMGIAFAIGIACLISEDTPHVQYTRRKKCRYRRCRREVHRHRLCQIHYAKYRKTYPWSSR